MIDFKPTVNRFGEIPSESAIYAYLSGTTSIKAELIPYIAEVLEVTEQELFDKSVKSKKKCFKYFLQDATKEELEYFNNFINYQIHNNININYGSVVMNANNLDNELEEFIELLEYAPKSFLKKVIDRLKEYKKLENKIF